MLIAILILTIIILLVAIAALGNLGLLQRRVENMDRLLLDIEDRMWGEGK